MIFATALAGRARAVAAPVAATAVLCLLPTAAGAVVEPANPPGGVEAPAAASSAPASPSGASVAPSPATPAAAPAEAARKPAAGASVRRPLVGLLEVPASAPAGSPPRVVLEIVETGIPAVLTRVTVTSLATRRPVLVVPLGWIRTERLITVRWPVDAKLAAGSYHVSLTAKDVHGATLWRRTHSSGVATLTVAAPAPPAASLPGTPAPEAGVPTPAETVADGAVFPVAGPHNFGGPENRFGAPREGYSHQGQDILTAEGTPDVAPLGGTIMSASYQASRAGYYLVERTNIGFELFFAHCEAESFAVSAAETVTAGQQLCRAGQTGDATTPHLDFEMWVGGWQAPTGHPIDPLPYLEAWEQAAAGTSAPG
jgi:murein DD-endopeptidase MepM/ murein hydrolase activator NlpD